MRRTKDVTMAKEEEFKQSIEIWWLEDFGEWTSISRNNNKNQFEERKNEWWPIDNY